MFPPSPSNHHQGQHSIVAEAEHLNCLLPVSTFQNCTVISQSGVSALERERWPCSKLEGYENWGKLHLVVSHQELRAFAKATQTEKRRRSAHCVFSWRRQNENKH